MDRIRKLNTKEDHFNFHKILGITCLIHYIYRYSQLLIYKTSGLDNPCLINLFLMTLHVLLSTSSLMFKVLLNRNPNHSFIYEEQRLQSIVFTLRAYSAYLCLFISKKYEINESISIFMRFVFIIGWHLVIDHLSKIYKNDTSGTLIRGSDKLYETRASRKHYLIQMLTKKGMLVASMSQIFVTGTLIYDGYSDLFTIALFNILPIQVGLFLSTLVKKGIISNSTNNVMYILLLFIVGTTKKFTIGNSLILLLVCFLRFHLKVNKYLLWFLYTIVYIQLR